MKKENACDLDSKKKSAILVIVLANEKPGHESENETSWGTRYFRLWYKIEAFFGDFQYLFLIMLRLLFVFVVVLQPKSILNLFCIHRSWRETYRPLIGRHLTIDNLLTKSVHYYFWKVRFSLILWIIMNIYYMCEYLPSKYSRQLIIIMEYFFTLFFFLSFLYLFLNEFRW